MADSNSYRRRAEKYKRVLLDYEMRLQADFSNTLNDLKNDQNLDNRSALAMRVERIYSTLISGLKELRGF